MCPSLLFIDYGTIAMTGFTPNSTVTYTCWDGYELIGHQNRTCQTTGEWTGQEPRCSCSSPPTICETSRKGGRSGFKLGGISANLVS